MTDGKVIGVIAIKGGVGKTTTVVNLATSLAREQGKKVLVIDANFSSPNLSLHLGFAKPGHSLNSVLNDEVMVHEAIVEHEWGFDVLPASLTADRVNPLKLKQKISVLKKQYDVILLDSSPSLNDELLGTMLAADELFVMSSPDYATLSTTLRAVKLAKEKNVPIVGLIMNHVRGEKHEISFEEVENAVHVPVLAVLQNDQKVLEALAAVQPITMYRPMNKVSLEYRRLAAALVDAPFKDPNPIGKIVNKFKEDVENFRNHDFRNGLNYYK